MRMSDWSSDVCSSDLGKMDGERRAGRAEGGEAFARRHGAGPSGRAGEDHRLAEFGQRQFGADGGSGGGEGGDAGRDAERNADRFQPPQLLAHGRPDGQVDGMKARSVIPRLMGIDDDGDDQIGRASGRERVCLYVSIAVVAGSLNKKSEYMIKTS